MNNEMMSIIFASDNETKLNELTIHRTTASLPFCGRYRFIDFTLSNLVNSNITTIGIVTRNNYSSLMDHIRMGRDWDLNRKNSGIAPPYASNTSRTMFKGKIEALYGILDYIEKATEEYVVLTNSNIATNLDFEDVYKKHIAAGADITMLTYSSHSTSSRRVLVDTDKSGNVPLDVVATRARRHRQVGQGRRYAHHVDAQRGHRRGRAQHLSAQKGFADFADHGQL